MPASRTIIALCVSAALGILLLGLWLKPAPPSPDPWPQNTLWICQAPGCEARFELPVARLGTIYTDHPPPGSPIACRKCGSHQTTRASVCPHCNGYVPRSIEQRRGIDVTCPHCREPVSGIAGEN